jgi:hypothetical protein
MLAKGRAVAHPKKSAKEFTRKVRMARVLVHQQRKARMVRVLLPQQRKVRAVVMVFHQPREAR